MPGNYTLELELFSLLNGSVSDFEIYADGALLGGYSTTVSSAGSTISVLVPYGGALPTSLEFRFTDSAPGSMDTIEVRAVKINDRYVNTGNYLSGTILNDGGSQTVDVTNNAFLFDASEPSASEFTTGATQTYTAGADTYRDYTNSTPQVFDMLGGRDVAYLGDGDDKVNGNGGNDILHGRGGADLLYGAAGNDRLFGGDGDDTLYGGDDNDRIQGDAGEDEIHGGAGVDRLIGGADNDVITGGTGNDTLLGGSGDDYLFGDGDDDTIIGGTGADTIDGGSGADLAYGGAGIDHINGGADDDILIGNGGNDVIHGDGGDDIIYGLEDDDTIFGGAGDDFIDGGINDDTIDGGTENDILKGGAGIDIIDGGAGDDILHGHSLTTQEVRGILNANAGVVYNGYTNSFYLNVTGGANHATAYAAATGMNINGIAGHLVNVTSADEQTYITTQVMTGGEIWIGASDEAQEGHWEWTDGAEAGLYFWEGGPANFGGVAIGSTYNSWPASGSSGPNNAGAGQDLPLMYAGGDWDDTDGSFGWVTYVIEWDAGLINDDGAIDTLTGGAGNDTIYGYGGDDVLDGGADDDVIFGGDGDDTLEGGSGGGVDSLYGGAGDDSLFGRAGADVLHGGADDDTIFGGDQDDIITGGTGIDIIRAGDDNDTIRLANGDFAAGEDIDGGADTDELILTNATTVDFTTGTLAQLETLTGSEGNDDITYTITQAIDFDDIDLGGGTDNSRVQFSGSVDLRTLTAPTVTNAENGFLIGSAGEDQLQIDGSFSLDSLVYGGGVLDFGGDGRDVIRLYDTSVSLNTLLSSDALLTNLERFVLDNSAVNPINIDASGQSEGFRFTNVGANNTIVGGQGNDRFENFFGANNIQGNSGNDLFELTTASVIAGSTLDGGADTDSIRAQGTVDFTTSTLSNFESLSGQNGSDEIITISGTQLDQFSIVNFGLGTDVLNITSTSTGLNNFANGSLVNIEEISASTAGAGVTIDLSNQTEDFTLTGSGFNDMITGGSGADIIDGGADNDTITGGLGNDIITGGLGNDILSAGNNNDTVNGGDGDDNIDGGQGRDTIDGGIGDDTITLSNNHFGVGESIDGGANNDELILTDATTVDFTTGTLTGLETLTGSTGIDVVTIDGTTLNQFNELDFGAGTNILNVTSTSTGLNALADGNFANIQTVSASTAGASVAIDLSAQTENLIVTGSVNDDTLTSGAGNDTINGGVGDDVLSGEAGDDILNGGDDNDTLLGGAGADTLNGGNGNDYLHGNSLTQAQIDAILTANPTVVYNAGSNSFYEFVASGAGWTASQPLAAASVLNGVNGHLATITNTAEMNYLDSQVNPTNNTSIGSYWTSGNDLITTGDWIFTDGIEAGVQFWSGQDAGSTVNGFDDMWVAGQPNSATQNYVYLLSYSDGLADSNDAPFAHGDGYIVEWDAGLMNDDNAIDILNGGAGNDHLYGYGGGDTLNGGAGIDLLFGGAGNDTLSGDADADVLIGGAGDDTIYGDDTTAPTRTSTQGWNFQYYDLAFTATPDLNGAGFTLNSGRDHNLGATTAGTASDFTPNTYDVGDDYALKFETTLTITTGGTYTFRTNSDDGSMLFLDGVQIVNNDGLHGNVTVTSAGQVLAAGTYTLELTFFERAGGNVLGADISGPDTGNVFTGLATYVGANVVTHSTAGGSDDIINGGAGVDTLYGGGGSDTFIFEAASAFADTDIIMDFSTTDGDILDISDILSGVVGITAANIKDYISFTSDGATGDTLVQVDADGTTSGVNFQTIARLDSIVGLDEVSLYNAGDIIV